ncbi:MAG: galactitol-1-phosphate 5-dehydrogenase [Clostridia bacterium]|nr:galactitol-1-phosphate 5-dehydrogenase [Clostridia bacterium]
MRIRIYEDKKYVVEPTEKPICGKDEVLMKVKACGVCGSDVGRVFAGAAYYYPIVLGHEFSGEIAESDDSDLIGKRACVFPLLPCKKCEFCAEQAYANCVSYDYYGSRRDGAMQDWLCVKRENLVFLPDNVSFEAGAMVEPAAVCLHAVKKAQIQKGESIVIFGAGTIGMLCGMWAKHFGAAHVYFVDIDEKKLDMAKALGFEVYDNQSVEIAVEASGAAVCLNNAINFVKARGRIVIVGNSGADVTIAKATYAQILRKQLTFSGSWNSDFSDRVNEWKESVEAISKGYIDPEALITHRIPLSDGSRAFDIIKNREFFNKIMVVEK